MIIRMNRFVLACSDWVDRKATDLVMGYVMLITLAVIGLLIGAFAFAAIWEKMTS